MERNGIDKVFELCLLLVTVIGAAELQYASFIFSQNSPFNPLTKEQYLLNLAQSNFVFRITTLPIFILVTTWLVLMVLPQGKFHGLEKYAKRRYIKEFCWTFFGNLLVLEIIIFTSLSFSKEVSSSVSGGLVVMIISFFLTFLVTWQYRKGDPTNFQDPIRFRVFSAIEHGLIYFFSYYLILVIVGWSIIVPTP